MIRPSKLVEYILWTRRAPGTERYWIWQCSSWDQMEFAISACEPKFMATFWINVCDCWTSVSFDIRFRSRCTFSIGNPNGPVFVLLIRHGHGDRIKYAAWPFGRNPKCAFRWTSQNTFVAHDRNARCLQSKGRVTWARYLHFQPFVDWFYAIVIFNFRTQSATTRGCTVAKQRFCSPCFIYVILGWIVYRHPW